MLQITLLLAKYDFLNTYTAASAEMKHYLLYNIIAEVGSGSLWISNTGLSVAIVVTTCVEKTSI